MFCSKPTIRNGFTLLEVVTALLILGTICATVLTAMNRAIAVAIDLRKRTQAFEVARENMENLLCLVSVSEVSDFGIDPLHPDIEWETTVESFSEPATNKMWIQAVCTASYPDSSGEIQKVTLTHWLTGLSDKQAQMILDQQKRESEYMNLLNDNDRIVQEQEAIRRYLREMGLELKPYSEILTEQKREKRKWINEYEYDPELFGDLMGSLRDKEYEWLDSIRFNWDDFTRWRLENPNPEKPVGSSESFGDMGSNEVPKKSLIKDRPVDSQADREMQEFLNSIGEKR
ncbi:MAG: type II secretion system protein [Phycisphaerae bacterium]|nr:type II secretion system protein [Phycisphaerae bacterium]